MKLLTFLGARTEYKPTTYVYRESECEARFAPVASCHFLRPDSLTVFLTEEAHQEVFPAFQAAVPAFVSLNPAKQVAHGRNRDELWQIFGQVADAVQPGEEVAFDITHGFRLLPAVGLLAAAFLRSGLHVQVRAVLYGAWQAETPARTPMLDLEPMLALLEWAAAADRFNETGDARYLSALLARAERREPPDGGDGKASKLADLASALARVSQALRLIRPKHTQHEIARLRGFVEGARPALASSGAALPFSLLMDSIESAYRPLGLAKPDKPANVRAWLERQRLTVNWYVRREQWPQAATLGREWVVNWAMMQLGYTELIAPAARRYVEDLMGAEMYRRREMRESYDPATAGKLAALPVLADVLDVWEQLGGIRNDINHAGFNRNARMQDALIEGIKECVARLTEWPLPAEAENE